MNNNNLRFSIVTATKAFVDAVDKRAKAFKASNGFGRWLREYQQMDENGLFEPKELISIYKAHLNKTSHFGFLQRQAAYYICTLALEDTVKMLTTSSFDIQFESGKLYEDEDGDTIEEVEYLEALQLAVTINSESEDEVCIVEHETGQVVWIHS